MYDVETNFSSINKLRNQEKYQTRSRATAMTGARTKWEGTRASRQLKLLSHDQSLQEKLHVVVSIVQPLMTYKWNIKISMEPNILTVYIIHMLQKISPRDKA